MKVTETKLDNGFIRLDALAAPAEVNRAFGVARRIFLSEMGIAPERGKTAEQTAQERLGIRDLDSLVTNQAAEYLVPFAIDKRNIMPAWMPEGVPQFKEPIKMGKPFEFSVEVMPKPHYEINSYEPLELTVPKAEVSEEEIDAQIAQIANNYAEFVRIEDHPVGENDSIQIGLSATQGGEPVASLTADGRTYIMGSNFMPEEFERNLLGMTVGEEKTFEVNVPGRDGEAADPVVFTVVLQEVQEHRPAVIDDKWVRQNFPQLINMEGLRASLRESLLETRRGQIEQYKQNAAAAAIGRRFEAKIDERIIEETQRSLRKNYQQQAAAQKMTMDQFIQATGGQIAFDVQVNVQARQMLETSFALEAVFRHERLKVTDADVYAVCYNMNPSDPRQALRQMEDNGRSFVLREAAEHLVAGKWLAAHATLTEVTEEEANAINSLRQMENR